MRKLKDASRENDGKKSQIIEWLSTNSGSIQKKYEYQLTHKLWTIQF